MKERLQGIITGVLIGSIATCTIGVFAAQYVANDNPFPVTYNGNRVYPQGYNIDGSTYFKLRDIADIVGGFNVDFQNNTIVLTNTNGSTPAHSNSVLKPYNTSSDYTRIKDITSGGKYFKDVVQLDTLNEGRAYYNLNGQYSAIKGQYGSIDDDYRTAEGKAVLRFYGDGNLLKELNFNSGQLPTDFYVSTSGVTQLIIEAQQTTYASGYIAIMDMSGI